MDGAQEEGSVRTEAVPRESTAKVKRTYGRKKEVVDASDDNSYTKASYRTRLDPADKVESLGYGHLMRITSDDASNAFGWKEKLALIDKQFDELEQEPARNLTHRFADDPASKDNSSAKSTSTEDDSSGLLDETLLSGSIPLPSSQSDPPSPGPSELKIARTKTLRLSSDVFDSAEPVRPEPKILKSSSDLFGATALASPTSSDDERGLRSAVEKPPSVLQNSDELPDESKRSRKLSGARRSSAAKPKERTNKIKKPSKKEEKESKKAHARLMADQKVSITKRAEQYTVEHLLKSVQQGQLLSEVKPCIASSDPIQEFTSSPMVNAADPSTELEPKAGPSGLQCTSDEDMPDVHELLKQEAQKQQKEEAEAHRRKSLALAKRRALESLKAQVALSESSDDDLEVVAGDKEGSSKQKRTSTALEKKLANVAGFRAGATRHSLPEVLESSQGERALKLAAETTLTHRDTRRTRARLNHRDLQAVILNKATKQSVMLTKEKEEEWKRRGGQLAGKQRAALASGPLSLGHLAENLALKRQHSERKDFSEETEHVGSDSDDDSDDEDWHEHGSDSVSPPNNKSPKASRSDDEDIEGTVRQLSNEDRYEGHVALLQEPININTDEVDNEDLGEPSHKARRTRNHLVISDSEGEEDRPHRATGRVLVPDTSMIIDDFGQRSVHSSEGGPDEDNKENDTPPAIDSGDDKENALLMPLQRSPTDRPRLVSRQPSRVISLEDRTRRLSMSPMADAENEDPRSVRKPLQTRRSSGLDDPFVLRSPSSGGSPKTPRSKRPLSTITSPVSLQAAFDGSVGGLTQIFNDEEGVHMAPATGILQPAFRLHLGSDTETSPIRSSVAPKEKRLDNLSGALSTEKRSKYLRRDEELSLTLDTKLQPALDVTTQVRRRADAVFDKEQNFVVEEANTSATSTRSKQELYISENGLLTQTKPEGTSPVVYHSWTPSQKLALSGSQATPPPPTTTQRLPLSTLSLASDTISPSQQRLTRLIKGKGRAELSDDGDILNSSSPADRPVSAFTKLLEGARKQQKKENRKLGKSHFVEGEAVESDEDEMFGFGRPAKKDDDEESDDDDPDAVVENLVDDAAMDVKELAEDKVLEKVKEQIEEEDAALQKLHQAVVEGKYRGKRRGGGIAMDDSESDEDEDDEARRLRRRMHKKRRIMGDKLEDLKKDEKSRAFYDAYQRDIQEEDDDDFVHLAADDMDDEDGNDENEEPESISTTDIRDQLREAARQQKGKERELQPFDSENVEWVHPQDTSDDEFEVKEVDDRPRRAAQRRLVFGQMDVPIDDSLPRKTSKLSEEQIAQLAAWRKEESGRNIGTGGMRGSIIVTGHGAKGTTNRGAGSRLRSATSQQESEQPVRKKMTKTASVLASVSDRHSSFGL